MVCQIHPGSDRMVDVFTTTYAIMKGFTDINGQKILKNTSSMYMYHES